jgi:hypothetical protein
MRSCVNWLSLRGRAVLRWQEHEQLELDFEPRVCLTDKTGDGSICSRLYVGIDGFMLPMVSDVEQGKRFEQAKKRRKTLKRQRGRKRLKRRMGARAIASSFADESQ